MEANLVQTTTPTLLFGGMGTGYGTQGFKHARKSSTTELTISLYTALCEILVIWVLKCFLRRTWQCMTVIPASGRWKQEEQEFKEQLRLNETLQTNKNISLIFCKSYTMTRRTNFKVELFQKSTDCQNGQDPEGGNVPFKKCLFVSTKHGCNLRVWR